jgi:hypothetical protein
MSLTRWKGPLRRVLGDTAANALIEFLIRSELREALNYYVINLKLGAQWGSPFNGQKCDL